MSLTWYIHNYMCSAKTEDAQYGWYLLAEFNHKNSLVFKGEK